MDIQRAMGSIYFEDPVVDRQHLITHPEVHTMKYTLHPSHLLVIHSLAVVPSIYAIYVVSYTL
jgi:hypothetical protein